MASIAKRGDRWLCRVTRGGVKAGKTFTTRRDAERWGRDTESAIERGTYQPVPVAPPAAEVTTFGDTLARYRDRVAAGHRGAAVELIRVRAMLRSDSAAAPLLALPLARVTAADVAGWRDRRLAQVSSATARREWTVLRSCWSWLRSEAGFPDLGDPFATARKPADCRARDRVLSDAEIDAIISATDSPELGAFIKLAVSSGARRGELLAVQWRDVDLRAGTMRLEHTKNGVPRSIPLVSEALDVLRSMPRQLGGKLFASQPGSMTQAFNRAAKRAGVHDVRIHDLRHTSLTRLAALGLSAPELAAVSGHKTLAMLNRYVHLQPEDVGRRIAQLSKEIAA